MGVLSKQARRGGVSPAMGKVSAACVLLLGLGALGSVQAATLSCGPGATPVRVNTADKMQWSTDARYVAAPNDVATIVDDYKWSGWLDLSTHPNHPANPPRSLAGTALQGKWLSFGATKDGAQYPAVNTRGVAATGAWVANRAAFIYGETITIEDDVDLSTIKIQGSGSADNNAQFAVRAHTLPGGVDNLAATPIWTQSTALLGGTWSALTPINLDGSKGLGFYYGDNTIALTTWSEATTASLPTGIVADFEITAECREDLAPPPPTALSCPADKSPGEEFEIGPFTTNTRDWTWTWRTSASNTLEEVTQPLYDDYRFRSYFNPKNLPAGQETKARWISPGTTSPAGNDVPGVPYPEAIGQHKPGYYGSVFTLNNDITVGDDVDLDSIKLKGRFGFDDTGDSVFVKPAGASTYYQPLVHLLPDGYGGFTTLTTAAIPGFEVGNNTIGLVLDGVQAKNDCVGGMCAMGAIAEFNIVATCKEAPPADPTVQIIDFRQPNPGVYSALNGPTVAWAPTPPTTSNRGLPVTYSSLTPSVCTVAPATGVVTLVSPAVAGDCTIEANAAAGVVQDADGNDVNVTAATPVTRTMQITLLKAQNITFPTQESHNVADGTFPLDTPATASSGLPVTYTSLTPEVCSVSSTGTVTPKKAGTCTIAADQPGNDEYGAAAPVTVDIILTGEKPVITPVPTLDIAGLGLLGLLSAGLGALGLRRRKRAQ